MSLFGMDLTDRALWAYLPAGLLGLACAALEFRTDPGETAAGKDH
jgi:hypothetical protein